MVSSNPVPAAAEQRTKNPLRPGKLADVIGQEPAKVVLRQAVESCFARRHPLPHTLIVGPSGTGKSTLAHVLAEELGVDVYELEAPVSYDTLAALRTRMYNGDILKIEEIHQQAIMERRGRGGATQPEVLYALMEDRVLQSPDGPLPYPQITVMGTTTDEGMLPDAFINRFPLRPRLVRYGYAEMRAILAWNAQVLGLQVTDDALSVFAGACRGVPREANNLIRNALLATPPGELCGYERAVTVLVALGLTADGLTADMQATLVFLLTRAERTNGKGEVVHQASVNTIATAIGKSRDSKAVALRIEPYLIEQGYLQVGHGGRTLTRAGIKRATELLR